MAGTLGKASESPWHSDLTTGKAIVDKDSIQKIILADNVAAPKNAELLFSTIEDTDQGLKNLTEIENLNNLNTSRVKNMSGMFYKAGSLTNLDLVGFNTANILNMSAMFQGAAGLTSIDLSSFDTFQVTNMTAMFESLQLNSLKLVSKFTFKSDTTDPSKSPKLDMPLPLVGRGTGKWVRKAGKSASYAPNDFMAKYGTTDLIAGEYTGKVENELTSGAITYDKPNGEIQIGDQITATIKLIPKYTHAFASLENIILDLDQGFITSFYHDSKANLQFFNSKDQVLSRENVSIVTSDENKEVGGQIRISAFPINAAYGKVSVTGKIWNNPSSGGKEGQFNLSIYTNKKTEPNLVINSSYYAKDGDLNFVQIPSKLTFKKTLFQPNKKNMLIDRLNPDWAIQIYDYRGTLGTPICRKNWEIVATSSLFVEESTGKLVGPETLSISFVDSKGIKHPLTSNNETLIESHSVIGETPKENHNIQLKWTEATGLKALVGNSNNIRSQESYTAKVNFELRQAP